MKVIVTKGKVIISGNTKIVIYSDLANLTEEEKKQWFETEKANGNQILKQITEAMVNCYQ